MTDTNLSSVTPDFDTLVEALMLQLEQDPSWTDLLPYSAGRGLIEFIASMGTMLHYSIEKAVQETYNDTATLDKSIFRAARLLGVSPARNSPSQVAVELTVTGTGNIPAYTQFRVDTDTYFNLDPIIHPNPGAGTAIVQAILYQGVVSKKQFVSNGEAYQSYVFGKGFTVCENFLDVRVGGQVYTRTRNPLWDTDTLQVFQDRTKPDGSVEIIFGNGTFGSIPPLSSVIEVTYAECKGSAANKALSNLTVVMLSDVTNVSAASGYTASDSTGSPQKGRNADTADFVKFTSPRLFAASKTAVRRDDWRALALTYPGKQLADALVWGEHEQRFIAANSFGPMNLNVVRVAVLPESGVLTALEIDDFTAYLEQYKMVNSQLVVTAPQPVAVRLSINVYITSNSQLATVNDYVLSKIKALFGRRRGSLGAVYHITDITRAILTDTAVDYCQVTSLQTSVDAGATWITRTDNITLQPIQYAVLQEPVTLVIQTSPRGDS